MLNLLSTVLRHAERVPERDCVRLFSRRRGGGARAFGQVAEDARRAAAFYRARGVGPGDIVALMGGHDVGVYGAWLGALWVGATPVFLAEPSVRIDKQTYWSRLSYLLTYLDAKLLALSAAIDASSWPIKVGVVTYPELAAAGPGGAPSPHEPGEGDRMLLQHSSGTTGVPKGVQLTHGMVARYAEVTIERMGVDERDVVVSWLPLYHDLGLFNCFIIPMFAGIPTVSLSTFEWVADPELQLEAIHEHRGTISYMPNFAFALLAASVADPGRYDLSMLRGVWSGGEPPSAADMLAFSRRFEVAGFRREALQAGYGMAESVAGITSSGPGVPLKFHRILKSAWRERHEAVPAGEGEPAENVLVHVSNGTMSRGCEMRVLGPGGERLPPGRAGRVFVRTPFLFGGYFRRDDLNQNLFDADGFYDTGDIGYLDDEGHVYVSGRSKDLIIVGGRNVYSQDVEKVANEVPGVHAGRTVCFGVSVPSRGTEGAVLLAESDLPEADWPALAARLREAVVRFADVDLADVKLAPRGVLRKSTAGKLARPDNRALYLQGRFGPPPPVVAVPEPGAGA
ncbi:MAG TPA: AMP-binding protein [Polyangiaceae bacterium]|nr:AMP-binding protein [Polyangiaceae bacterium]